MSVNFLLEFTAQARTVRNLKSGAGTVATHSAEVLYVYAACVCVYIYQHIHTFPSSDTVCTYISDISYPAASHRWNWKICPAGGYGPCGARIRLPLGLYRINVTVLHQIYIPKDLDAANSSFMDYRMPCSFLLVLQGFMSISYQPWLRCNPCCKPNVQRASSFRIWISIR